MTKILFVRHGETNYNLLKLCNSSGPEVFLTENGINQAKLLNSKLASENIDQIIVSPTFRTRETFKYLSLPETPHEEDVRISELKTNYEGKPISEYMNIIGDSIKGKIIGGESVEDLFLRVNSFLEEIKNKKGKTILVITHSLVIKTVKVIFENKNIEDVNSMELPKNGEVYSITFQ